MRRRSGKRWLQVGAVLGLVAATTLADAYDDNVFDPTRPVVAIETIRAMVENHARNERTATATFNADANAAVAASRATAPASATGGSPTTIDAGQLARMNAIREQAFRQAGLPVPATLPAGAAPANDSAAGLARTLNPAVDPTVAASVARADDAHRAATDRNVLPFDEQDGDLAAIRVGRQVDKRGRPVSSAVIAVPSLANWVNVVAPGHPAYAQAVSWDAAMQQLRDFNARHGIDPHPPRPTATGRYYTGQPTNVVTQPAPERVPDGVQVDPLTGERFDSRTGKPLPASPR